MHVEPSLAARTYRSNSAMSRPINKTRNLFRQAEHNGAKSRMAYQVRDKIATGKLTPGALGKFDSVYPSLSFSAVRRDIFPIFSGFSLATHHRDADKHTFETKQTSRMTYAPDDLNLNARPFSRQRENLNRTERRYLFPIVFVTYDCIDNRF